MPLELEVSPNGILDLIDEIENGIYNSLKNNFKEKLFKIIELNYDFEMIYEQILNGNLKL